MKITGFLPESFQDWDAGLSSVVFVGRCNFACPSCHARELLYGDKAYDAEKILGYLSSRMKYISRLVVTGGEAALDPDIVPFLSEAKNLGLAIKLDTNGSAPEKLQEILDSGSVNHLALDIKGPMRMYPLLTGSNSAAENMSTSLELAQRFEGYELRTTIVPVIENGTTRWMSPDEMKEMISWAKPRIHILSSNRHYLQNFTARGEKSMISSKFSTQSLDGQFHTTPSHVMHEALRVGKEEGYEFLMRN